MKFVCEELGVKDMRNHNYSEVFDVTKEEVYQYVFQHGIPRNSSTSRCSLGFHFFGEGGK